MPTNDPVIPAIVASSEASWPTQPAPLRAPTVAYDPRTDGLPGQLGTNDFSADGLARLLSDGSLLTAADLHNEIPLSPAEATARVRAQQKAQQMAQTPPGPSAANSTISSGTRVYVGSEQGVPQATTVPAAAIRGAFPERPFLAPSGLPSDQAAFVCDVDDFLRLGDVRLPLRVDRISVQENASLDTVPILRNAGTMKRNAGHLATRVDIQLEYLGLHEINGYTLDYGGHVLRDPATGEYPILTLLFAEHCGLRPLIATFKRAPFIPVVNRTLNDEFGIDALAFAGMQVTTVEDAADSLAVTLSFLKFDYNAYIPDAENFASLFCWPLYSKYVYNGLCTPEEHYVTHPDENVLERLWVPRPPKLTPVPVLDYNPETQEVVAHPSLRGGCAFEIADEDSLKALRDGAGDRMTQWNTLHDEQMRQLSDKLKKAQARQRRNEKKYTDLLAANDTTLKEWNSGYWALQKADDIWARLGAAYSWDFERDEVWRIYDTQGQQAADDYVATLSQKAIAAKDAFSAYKPKYNQYKLDIANEISVEQGRLDALQRTNAFPVTAGEDDEALLRYKRVELPAEAVLTNVEIGLSNTFASLQLEGREQPTLQYLGAQDTRVRLQFWGHEATVSALRQLMEDAQRLSRDYRFVKALPLPDLSDNHSAVFDSDNSLTHNQQIDSHSGQQIEVGFLKLHQELANLCGVESVLIEGVDFDTIPQAPNCYVITVTCVDFDRTQKKHEQLNRLRDYYGPDGMGAHADALQQPVAGYGAMDLATAHATALMGEDVYDKLLYTVELYRDLNLPTMATVNGWILDLYRSYYGAGSEQELWPEIPCAAELACEMTTTDPQHNGSTVAVPPDMLAMQFYSAPGANGTDSPGHLELLNFIRVDPDFYLATTGTVAQTVLRQFAENQEHYLSDEHNNGVYQHEMTASGFPKAGYELSEGGSDAATMDESITSDAHSEKLKEALRNTAIDPAMLTTHDGKLATVRSQQAQTQQQAQGMSIATPPPVGNPSPTSTPQPSSSVQALWSTAEIDKMTQVLKDAGLSKLDPVSFLQQRADFSLAIQEKNKGISAQVASDESFYLLLYALARNIDPYVFAGMIQQESRFDPTIVGIGPWYCKGLGQLADGTAAGLGITQAHVFDISANLDGSTRHLQGMSLKFGSVWRGIMAYNEGGGAYQQRGAPYATSTHLQKVCKHIAWYRQHVACQPGIAQVIKWNNQTLPSITDQALQKPGAESFSQSLVATQSATAIGVPVSSSAIPGGSAASTNTATTFTTATGDGLPDIEVPPGVDPQNGGASAISSPMFAHYADWYQYGCEGRLVRAFPTFWMVLIDGGRVMGNLLMNDNFYGFNGVASVTVVKHREHPAHLCVLEMSNVYGNLSNQTAQRALDEAVRRRGISEVAYYVKSLFVPPIEDIDIQRREQEVTGLFLQPGARLHVRLGYGSCPKQLPVVFNGTVTEVPGGDGLIEVIAQGDGMELLNDLQASPNQKLGSLFHGSEAQDLIGAILAARGGKPSAVAGGAGEKFQEWVTRHAASAIPGYKPENPFGIMHFGNPYWRATGERWGEVQHNLYRSNDREAVPGTDGDTEMHWDIWNHTTEWLAFLETFSWGQKEFSTDLYGKTVWDLCVMAAQVAPDYVAQVVPFQFRSSLFYGKPRYTYCYDYDLDELVARDDAGDNWLYGSRPSDWVDCNYDPEAGQENANFALLGGLTVLGAIVNPVVGISVGAGLLGAYASLRMKGHNIRTLEGGAGTAGWRKALLRKPFEQVYGLTATDHILSNSITASSEGVWTVVRGEFKCKHWLPWGQKDENGVSTDMTLPVYADYTMFPQNRRTAVVDTQIYVGAVDQLAKPLTDRDVFGNLPNNSATSMLQNFMRYMYKGNISIIGLPSIKPLDVIVIDDIYNEMHGPCGVREVVHRLALDTGFTTTIEPDCLVNIADQKNIRNWGLYRNVCGAVAYGREAAAAEVAEERRMRRINMATAVQTMEAIYQEVMGYYQAHPELKPKQLPDLTALDYRRGLYEACVRDEQAAALAPERMFPYSTPSIAYLFEPDRAIRPFDNEIFPNMFSSTQETLRAHRRYTQIHGYGTLPQDDGTLVVMNLHEQLGTPDDMQLKNHARRLFGDHYAPMKLACGPTGLQIDTRLAVMVGVNDQAGNLPELYTLALDALHADRVLVDAAIERVARNPRDYTRLQAHLEDRRAALLEKHQQTLTEFEQVMDLIYVHFGTEHDEAIAELSLGIKNLPSPVERKHAYEHMGKLAAALTLLKVFQSDRDLSGLLPDIHRAMAAVSAYYEISQAVATFDATSTHHHMQYSDVAVSFLLREFPHAWHPAVHQQAGWYQVVRAAPVTLFTQWALPARLCRSILLSRKFLNGLLWTTNVFRGFRTVWGTISSRFLTPVGARLLGSGIGTTLLRYLRVARTSLVSFVNDLRDTLRAAEALAGVRRLLSRVVSTSARALEVGRDVVAYVRGVRAAQVSFAAVNLSLDAIPVVGWIKLAAEIAITIAIDNLVNMLNRMMRNLHAVQIMVLRKHGAEFSAGINGHQGLVWGDSPHKLQSFFNKYSGMEPLKGWEYAGAVVSSVLGVKFPYVPYMSPDEQKEQDKLEDLFNSRSYGANYSQSSAMLAGFGALGLTLSRLLDPATAGP